MSDTPEQMPAGAIPPKAIPTIKPPLPAAVLPPAGAPLTATIRLKPVMSPVPGVPASIRVPTVQAPVAAMPKRATSRIAVPNLEPATPQNNSATIRLRPVGAPVPNTKVSPLTPTVAQALVAANPNPVSAAVAQATKSKTSRITLDGVIATQSPIAVTPSAEEDVKTIRLKRPAARTAPIPAIEPSFAAIPGATAAPGSLPISQQKPASSSHLPPAPPPKKASGTLMPPAGSAPAESNDDAEMTQKKTIKVKRPGLTIKKNAIESSSADSEFPEGTDLKPISDLDMMPVGKPDNKAFSVIAIIAASVAIILSLLTICATGAQTMEPAASPNTLGTLDAPPMPWGDIW